MQMVCDNWQSKDEECVKQKVQVNQQLDKEVWVPTPGSWENLPLETLKGLSGSLRSIRSNAITFYMMAAPTSRCTFSCDSFSQQSETKLLTV